MLAAVVTSFASNDELYCAEGAQRVAESALAMKKASPLGGLFNASFGHTGVTCEERGYTVSGGPDSCCLGVTVLFRDEADIAAFALSHNNTLKAYGARYGLDDDTVGLMQTCTCQPSSDDYTAAGDRCGALDDTPGCWVHKDPYTGAELICDEGPFVFATRALSVLKGSPQLAMHFRDPVRAVDCASLGFPVKLDMDDHCYPALRVWTRNSIVGPQGCDGDWGCHESVAVEANLTTGGGFGPWAGKQGLDSGEVATLTNELGCNCLVYSSVAGQMGDYCDSDAKQSPVRDWWNPVGPQGLVVV